MKVHSHRSQWDHLGHGNCHSSLGLGLLEEQAAAGQEPGRGGPMGWPQEPQVWASRASPLGTCTRHGPLSTSALGVGLRSSLRDDAHTELVMGFGKSLSARDLRWNDFGQVGLVPGPSFGREGPHFVCCDRGEQTAWKGSNLAVFCFATNKRILSYLNLN